MLIAHALAEINDGLQVASCLSRRFHGLGDMVGAPLSVAVDSFLFHPQGGRQYHISQFRGAGGVICFGHHHKDLLHAGTVIVEIRQGLARVSGHDPQAFEIPRNRRLEHFQSMIARLTRHGALGHTPDFLQLIPVLFIGHKAMGRQDMGKSSRLPDAAAGAGLPRKGRFCPSGGADCVPDCWPTHPWFSG